MVAKSKRGRHIDIRLCYLIKSTDMASSATKGCVLNTQAMDSMGTYFAL